MTHPTKCGITVLSSKKQCQPGPWNHSHKWSMDLAECNAAELDAMAADKATWSSKLPDVLNAYKCEHPNIHSNSAPNWRDCLRLNPAWRQGVHLASHRHNTWQVMWVNDEHGVQTFNRQGLLLAVLHLWMSWMQLEFNSLVLDLHMEQWVLEADSSDMQSFHEDTFRNPSVLTSHTCVESRDRVQDAQFIGLNI